MDNEHYKRARIIMASNDVAELHIKVRNYQESAK